MTQTESSSLYPVLRVDFPHAERLGRGKIELLEHIRETGSISAAGRAMDMSYRRAWLLVSALNGMFKQDAVESQRGGKAGRWRGRHALRRGADPSVPRYGKEGAGGAGTGAGLAGR